ncbi:MAG: glycosyltransferase family protein [Flavisolibacter sp.]
MKILYAIQGTGNGHITVAREVLPVLKQRADVDILISGHQVDIGLPYEIKYRFNGLGFVFGKNGGIDYLHTFRKSNVKQLFRDIQQLPVEEYDLVISDFEPVSAWSCYLKHKTCIGFSHQAAVVNKKTPKSSKKDPIGMAVLKYYAPVSHQYGFHYLPYAHNIFTPIIRKEIREQKSSDWGHYTVYLPSYSDKRILKLLAHFPEVKWEVFSKHCNEPFREGSISFHPVCNKTFIKSMASSKGILCNAGFQTPAEAIFLRKKLLVIPMKGQYEQQCNAAALSLLGVPVVKSLKLKHVEKFRKWIDSEHQVNIDFPDETYYILDGILENHQDEQEQIMPVKVDTPGKFRDLLLKKIFYQLRS